MPYSTFGEFQLEFSGKLQLWRDENLFVPPPLFNISLSGIFLQKVPRKPICQDFILIEEARCYAICATQMYFCNTKIYLQDKWIFVTQRYISKFTYFIDNKVLQSYDHWLFQSKLPNHLSSEGWRHEREWVKRDEKKKIKIMRR